MWHADTDDNGADPAWVLLDLDADGASELVTTDWASSGVGDLGTTKWWHYPNRCL